MKKNKQDPLIKITTGRTLLARQISNNSHQDKYIRGGSIKNTEDMGPL